MHLPSNLSRRALLRAVGAGGLTFSTLRAAAFGADFASDRPRRTLVLVFLRGGMDGLNLLVPYGDPDYARLRPGIGIPAPGSRQGAAVDLDGFFGLHPAAAPLAPLFASGMAAGVHAVGTPANTRSHFLEQDRWETAVDENGLETPGWLGRYLAASPGRGPIRALALGERLPRSLRGEVPALALPGLDQLVSSGGDPGKLDRTARALEKAYGGAGGALGGAGRTALDAVRQLEDVARNAQPSTVAYPDTGLGRRARELARLVRADVGLELVELDYGGWDTHENQGGTQGQYANRVRELAGALEALVRDLDDRMDDVMVLVTSEFGRTAAQNGTGGTDHGWGNCVLAL
ncbi:MAG: DUF1501 domain-containing protein, partial [Planctomycetota bacterium]